jgi:sirohydrochlorin cobaltochelatase
VKAIIVLVMHGVPPSDFPKPRMGEYFGIQARLMGVRGEEWAQLKQRYDLLDAEMRSWPRTPQNDPFHAGSHGMADHLSQVTGCEVLVSFNEYCDPDVDTAIDEAVAKGAEKIVIVTPMMTRGGEHSEMEIPEAIHSAQRRHPQIPMIYVWPFDVGEVAQFLASQISRFVENVPAR